jgi:hypothetical protein
MRALGVASFVASFAALGLMLGCKASVSKEQELCAKAAAMFERCEDLDQGSGSDAALTRELMIDRWRGLCRAVFTGKTEQLMTNSKELFNAMDEATKAGLRLTAECSAKATTCAEYKKCDE